MFRPEEAVQVFQSATCPYSCISTHSVIQLYPLYSEVGITLHLRVFSSPYCSHAYCACANLCICKTCKPLPNTRCVVFYFTSLQFCLHEWPFLQGLRKAYMFLTGCILATLQVPWLAAQCICCDSIHPDENFIHSMPFFEQERAMCCTMMKCFSFLQT